MKKNYTVNKKAVITTLSLAAVCLAGGLFYYINTMGGQLPETSTESLSPANVEVVVPNIEPETSPNTNHSSEAILSEKPSETPAQSTPSTNNETQGQVSKPSDGKPKSPSEAVPPSSPPSAATDNNVTAESEPYQDQPQGGEKRADGAIYVPGFGWVEYEGENSQGIAPNAGTGDPVGDMQTI